MAHTFLSLDVRYKIPKATKDNVPTFWSALYSNDGVKGNDGKWIVEPSRILLDGRNDKGELVHSWEALLSWLQWETDPLITLNVIVDDAIEYTAQEFNTLKNNVDSIWYIEQEALI
tara:strand:+ start:836 stop:1183 length:348 start_codon:yes stop_codon:yes gene_type:complete